MQWRDDTTLPSRGGLVVPDAAEPPEGFRNPAQPAPDLMLVGARRPANLSGLLFVVVLGLNLQLLLEYWLCLFGHLSLRQPQPDLRHME